MTNELNLSQSDLDALKRIRELFSEADQIFSKLSNETRDKFLDFHNTESSLNHAVRWGLQASEDLVEAAENENDQMGDEIELGSVFGYYINLDERGTFSADVRGLDDVSIFDIIIEDEDEGNIFTDGYMKNKDDLEGLTDYLKELKIINENSKILVASEFENIQSKYQTQEKINYLIEK